MGFPTFRRQRRHRSPRDVDGACGDGGSNGWREKATRGELVAPRVLAAGAAVGAESVEATRRQVREAKAAGADFVKVFSEAPEPQWRAILKEARALHLPVCGHIPGEVDLLDAATAGQRSNEHLTQVYEACSPREKQLLAARAGLDGKEIVALRDAQEREVLESFHQLVCDRTAAAPPGPTRSATDTCPSAFRGARIAHEFSRRQTLALPARG